MIGSQTVCQTCFCYVDVHADEMKSWNDTRPRYVDTTSETNIYPIVRKSAAQPAKTPETEKTIRPTIQLAAIEKVHLSTTLEASGELKNNPVEEKPAVKITYIASDQNSVDIEKDTVKFNLFNKVWSIAQNTSPIEIISDLRDAKDGLIEGGFKRN